MKRQTFLKGALIVSLGGIAAKIMGAFYRIPLANLLGGRGLGVYQMTYPLYCLLLTVSATGIPSGLARAVSRAEAAGNRARSEGFLRSALLLFAGIGLLGSAAMFLLAPLMSAAQGEPAAAAAYRALAPGVLLVSLVSCFRGWFQGRSNFLPTALSEILEQAVKIGLGLLFARMFAGNVPRAVAYTLLAVTLSEAAAAVFLFFCAAGHVHWGQMRQSSLRRSGAWRGGVPLYRDASARPQAAALLRITVPVTIAAGILPLSGILDSILIVRLVGGYAAGATALYGLYAGGAATLVNLPVSVCYGLAAASVPAVSALHTAGRREEAEKKTLFALKCTLFVSLPAAAFLFLYPAQVAGFLFRSVTGAEFSVLVRLVRAMALTSVLLSSVQTLAACLTGMGKARRAAAAMTFAVCVKLILESLLLRLPQVSVLGAAYATTACYLVALFLDLGYSIRERSNRMRAAQIFLQFSLAAAACVAAAYPLRGEHVLAILAVAAAVYLAHAVLFGAFRTRELRPFGRRQHDHSHRSGMRGRLAVRRGARRAVRGRKGDPAHRTDAARRRRARAGRALRVAGRRVCVLPQLRYPQ